MIYNTDISHFLKVHIIPLFFYKSLTLVPVFTNRTQSREYFHFYEKKQKMEIVFSICFAARLFGVLGTSKFKHQVQVHWSITEEKWRCSYCIRLLCVNPKIPTFFEKWIIKSCLFPRADLFPLCTSQTEQFCVNILSNNICFSQYATNSFCI